jgi:hypothetical protein
MRNVLYEAWLDARRSPRTETPGGHLQLMAPRFSCPAYGVHGTHAEVESWVISIRGLICDGCIIIGDDGRSVADVDIDCRDLSSCAVRWY